jgi:hypothetical protein
MTINNFTKLLILMPIFGLYAQKGVTIDWNSQTEPIENGSIKQTQIGLLFFDNIGTKNNMSSTFNYKSTTITDEIENYLLKQHATNYSSTHFNSLENTFEFTRLLTEKTKLTVAIEPTANYQNNLSLSDITILGGFEINQKLNNSNSIDLGIKRMTVFGRPEILPTFSFNHQFNKTVSFKLGFPNSELSYSNSIRNKFSLNNNFIGSSYNLDSPIVDDKLNTISKVGFSQVETTLQYERNMDTSWFVTIKGGYSSKKEFKFSDENRTNEINQALKNGSIFSISIKYKL